MEKVQREKALEKQREKVQREKALEKWKDRKPTRDVYQELKSMHRGGT